MFARVCKVPRHRTWCPVDVPFDGRRHRIRLDYESPELTVDREPGVRWWWRGVGGFNLHMAKPVEPAELLLSLADLGQQVKKPSGP